jgi:hypothetical protein
MSPPPPPGAGIRRTLPIFLDAGVATCCSHILQLLAACMHVRSEGCEQWLLTCSRHDVGPTCTGETECRRECSDAGVHSGASTTRGPKLLCSLKKLTEGHDADVEDASGGEKPGAHAATH